VPRIHDILLDCSVYLYPDEQTAREGRRGGGSGFLVAVPGVRAGTGHQYVVTAQHLIDGGNLVLRLNTERGIDTIKTARDMWFPHPEGDDITVLPIQLEEKFAWYCVTTDLFITPELIHEWRIGPGDDTFIIGRLVDRDGVQKNTPVVRFGNISMMADATEPIARPTPYNGQSQESFLVECRSLGGFSGSPVFVTTSQEYTDEILPATLKRQIEERAKKGPMMRSRVTRGHWGPWLLGIDWGHAPLWDKVYEKDRKTETDYRSVANTGLAYVAPAWRIMSALNRKDLLAERDREDDATRQEMK
jgi:hypothetical protein